MKVSYRYFIITLLFFVGIEGRFLKGDPKDKPKPNPKPKPGPVPEPTFMPTIMPAYPPSPMPTMKPSTSIVNETILNELTELLPNPEAIETINSFLSDEVHRVSSILYASSLGQSLSLEIPNSSCGPESSNNANCSKYLGELQLLSEKIRRGIECAYNTAEGNVTIMTEILSIAFISALKSEKDYFHYLNVSGDLSKYVADSKGELIFSQNYTTSNPFEFSCDMLGSILLNRTISMIPGTGTDSEETRRRRSLQTNQAGCSTDSSIYIIYINGMNCEKSVQEAGRMKLFELIKSVPLTSLLQQHYQEMLNPSVVVDNIPNPSEGFLVDLSEAIAQKFDEYIDRFESHDILVKLSRSPFFSKLSNVTTSAWNSLFGGYINDLYKKVQPEPKGDPVINSITAYVVDKLDHGHAVILVPHSQGNFYTNSAYQLLTDIQKQSVRIVSVANPAAGVGILHQTEYYGTRDDDKVIGGVPGALPVNIYDPSRHFDCLTKWYSLFTGDINFDTCINHAFLGAYIEDTSVWQNHLLPKIKTAISQVSFPSNTLLKNGFITVTMSWSADNPDVDLHVFEPSGFHVYYPQRTGVVGMLDHDDIDGSGPENYFVDKCGADVAGTYLVGVNYYSGNTPEIAHFVIKVGGETSRFSKQLPSSRGSSGDEDPYPVAKIIYNPTDSLFPIRIIGL